MLKFWYVYLCYCSQQLLLCHGFEDSSSSPCLTTMTNDDYFDITCKVDVIHSKIIFLDPRDNVAAFCTLPINTLSCKSNVRAGRIFQDLEKKTTIFRLSKSNLKGIDGVWKCIHGNDRTELLIETSAGIVNYVSLNLEAYVGNFVHEKQKEYLLIIKCETCWPPVGNTAAFYINSATKDEDEVKRTKGKCYHRGGECTADTCECSVLGYEYTWKFYIKTLIKGTNISCSMRFEDKKSHFIKEATVSYDGTGFINQRETTNVIREGIKKQNLTTTDKNITDSSDDNSTSWIVPVVVLIVLVAVGICSFKMYRIYRRLKFNPVPATDDMDKKKEVEPPIRIPVKKICQTKQKDEPININESTNAGFQICKACNQLTQNKRCDGCHHFFCEICSDHHRNCKGRTPIVSCQPMFKRSFSRYDGPRHELKFKRKVHVAEPTVRIRGVALLPDGMIVIADYANRDLHVFNLEGKVAYREKLLKEPRGLVRIYENNIAVTFAYEKEICLFSIHAHGAVNYKIFDLKDIGKPFSIGYDDKHFVVEVGEREDGKLVIFDEDGFEKFVIPNNKYMYAHFTGNSIDLGLNMDQEEVYLSSINNKAVYCFSKNGETKWVASVPIPQGVTAIRNSSSESRIILVTNKNGPHTLYEMCSSDGRTHMMKDPISSPRYITSTTVDESMFLCIEVAKRYLEVYEITEITEIIENESNI